MTLALLVDDHDSNRYYLEALLGGNGWRVVTARDGAQALALAEQDPPDLVISDLLMPVMDGYTLLRKWKCHPDLGTIPFIVHTATYTEAEDEQLALDLGADAFILKPSEPDELLRRVAEVMARPAAARPAPAGATPAEELETLSSYNQALIRKLEDKTRQLEEANLALRRDIARREAAEAALRASEERFRLLAQGTSDAAWDWNLASGERWWSPGLALLLGASETDLQGDDAWQARVHPDDREWLLTARQTAIASGERQWLARYRLRHEDGRWLQVEDRGHLVRDPDGKVVRMVGGLADITTRVSLEEQLQRAQRLEALGQLTGGVAHDFNNLLTVVLGNAQVLAEELTLESGLGDLARMIAEAAERGAELTQRLLAFARRQNLAPRAVDLDQLVADLTPLLRRALGGGISIDLVRGSAVPPAHIDPAQLEHALVNLCVNARDAMPGGGRLTIATGTAAEDGAGGAGPQPVLTVTDTGSGILPEHLGRVFEPFFSTKPEGKGSGLGLAMVYGFITQSGGRIAINSTPGQGTTFRLQLPAAIAAPPKPEPRLPPSPSGGGSETLLLAEDNDLVRELALVQLESLGYRVLVAADGREALDILHRGEAVDLLFTDVLMPGMNGPELLVQARQLRPGLKVLFSTGFAGQGDGGPDDLPSLGPVLHKPYLREELARRVREALGE